MYSATDDFISWFRRKLNFRKIFSQGVLIPRQYFKWNYYKLQCTNQLLKPEKISTKQGIDLYSKAKIQTFTKEWSTVLLTINTHHLSYLPNPSARAGYDTRSIFFKQSLIGLNSEFSFS